MSHRIERFLELRDELQAAHSQLGPQILRCCRLDVELGEDVSVSRSFSGNVEVIGSFQFPSIEPHEVQTFKKSWPENELRRIADATLMGEPRRTIELTGVVFLPLAKSEADRDREAAEKLRSLMDRAGRELPRLLRSAIPWGFEPRSYISRWLTLMFWHSAPGADTLDGFNRPANGWEVAFWSAFDDSASVIEDCGLTTEFPGLMTADGSWPVWAGTPPFQNGALFPGEGASTDTAVETRALLTKVLDVFRPLVGSDDEKTAEGVSLRDVAKVLCEGDPDVIRETKKRWHNSRMLPDPLGTDREDKRAHLYELSALLDFVKKVENISDADIQRLKRPLIKIRRPIIGS